MVVISEDNVIQIKLKMVIWIVGIIVIVFSTLFGWQEIQINNLKKNVAELEKEDIKENTTKIYWIKTEDIPKVFSAISVHQSQLNMLNLKVFQKENNVDLGFGSTNKRPDLPLRENN